MASAEANEGDRAVELIVSGASSPPEAAAAADVDGDAPEITPLLNQSDKPKINIFAISYPRRNPREQVIRSHDAEVSPAVQCALWVWSGSRYSGLLCMAASSMIYFLMEAVSDAFAAQSIPLFETAFARCTLILISSYLWLRKGGQPLFEPKHARKLLFSRAVLGYLSLMSFIYCIQRLPLSQAIVLSFTTPIMASIAARVILREKLRIGDIGGLACSYFGVLFIFQQMLVSQGIQGGLNKAGKVQAYAKGSHHILAVLVGLFSAITGGISFCLIRAGARETDQPMTTVFSFTVLASPAAGLCAFSFEDFVLPSYYTVFLMLVYGGLALLAELLLARALQLEKTSKVSNIQFIEVVLSQLWGISARRLSPSFGRLVGCFLILISACSTMYSGPDKETA
ncbi:hypothetical protein NL676_017664 [Syzygium grande]|nr:hypothetical protein NL676_017664 [Syzygium grande]